jgi:carboxyl-terminal processing protease
MGNMPGRRLPLVCLGAAFSLAQVAWAASPQEGEAARWIARLGSTAFRERDEATDALEKMGEEARAALEKAAKESTDPEVRRRVRSLLGLLAGRAVIAKAFVDKVLPIMEFLEENSVVNPGWGFLVEAALHGLYHHGEEEIPADLIRRLYTNPPRDAKGAGIFLRDGYGRLLRRRALVLVESSDWAIGNVLAELDPHASLEKGERAKFKNGEEGSPLGVGLRLCASPETGFLRVVTPVKDSPAHKAGIRPDDILTCITWYVDADGDPLPVPRVLRTQSDSLAEASQMLLGREGVPVELTITRRGVWEALTFKVARGWVGPETVMGWKRRRDGSWDYWIDPQKKIAYARILSLSRTTAGNLERALRDLCAQGMKGLLLDLRGNPGGLLQATIDVSELFVGARAVCTIRPRVGKVVVFQGHDQLALPDFALVCMIDEDTARGGEVVAACIQDHRRGLLLGRRSRGDGSIRNVQMLDDGDLILTTAVLCRPGGGKLDRIRITGLPTDEWGVIPDVVLPLKPPECEALKAHLARAEIVMGDPAVWEEIRGGFRDRQRDAALLLLRGLVKG